MNQKTTNETLNPYKRRHPARFLIFVLFSVAVLLLVFRYEGPYYEIVHSYGGNLTASFAVYFIFRSSGILNIKISPTNLRLGLNRVISAIVALLVVELFEATDGFFGLMSNTYDPVDFGVNAFGVSLAVAIDILASYILDKWNQKAQAA